MSAAPEATDAAVEVTIYTDGGCIGNPGPGGFGVVLLHGERRKEISCGYRQTTNNRMELLAAIAGLSVLQYPCTVHLVTDSRYLADGIAKGWARNWRARGWKIAGGRPARNADLWERLLQLTDRHTVRFSWVKGHAGNEENERCDALSSAAAASPDLRTDGFYERLAADEAAVSSSDSMAAALFQ